MIQFSIDTKENTSNSSNLNNNNNTKDNQIKIKKYQTEVYFIDLTNSESLKEGLELIKKL